MRRSNEGFLRRIVFGERRDIAAGISDAHQLVIQRDRVERLLLLRLGLLLFLSCVEKTRQTLCLRVGNMIRLTTIQILAQPFGIRSICGFGNGGVPSTRLKFGL
jgi:hypothetical protein